jgi:hypothetical protein
VWGGHEFENMTPGPRTDFGRWMAVGVQVLIGVLFAAAVLLSVSIGGGGWGPWLEALRIGVWIFAFSIVGLLVAIHRPGNAVAWVCLAFGLVWTVWSLSDALLAYDAVHTGWLGNPDLVAAMSYPFWVPGVGLVAVLLLIFPDGHLPSRAWRAFGWVLTATLTTLFVTSFFLPGVVQDTEFVNPLGVEYFKVFADGVIAYVLVLLLVLCLGGSAVALIARFRRSSGSERLQLKWLVAAGVVASLGYGAMFIREYDVQLAWTAIPIAIGFSMHRHRLYDIDRLVSRTFAYAVVVAVLAALYAATVFLVGNLVGIEGDLAVAVSTLVVAGAFNTVRRRIKDLVDRRFNRSNYDAQQVSDVFARNLREINDTDEITRGWVAVVGETMQPEALGVWIRPANRV